MIFEDIATSLATLASYSRGDLETPVRDMDHLYERALQEPPSYSEITALTGQSMQTLDRQCGRAAWLLMNIEELQIYGVHTHVWHKTGSNYSAPILNQIGRVLNVDSQLSDEQIQEQGVEHATLDILGVHDNRIWLVQVISSDELIESALSRTAVRSGSLFRGTVFKKSVLKEKQVVALRSAYEQMHAAFPQIEVVTMALVLHPTGPDFELYQVDVDEGFVGKVTLSEKMIKKNSIDYSDLLEKDENAFFKLRNLLESEIFFGIPPCRGGRTLAMLAVAANKQISSDGLLLWKRKDFIALLRENFDYEIENDKVRHDLDDRLVAQGFFRKWGADYFVSMKGVARYQYCLAKFTNKGEQKFDLELCVAQRDRINNHFGCIT